MTGVCGMTNSRVPGTRPGRRGQKRRADDAGDDQGKSPGLQMARTVAGPAI